MLNVQQQKFTQLMNKHPQAYIYSKLHIWNVDLPYGSNIP